MRSDLRALVRPLEADARVGANDGFKPPVAVPAHGVSLLRSRVSQLSETSSASSATIPVTGATSAE